MSIQSPASVLAIILTVILALFFPNAFWKRRRLNKSWNTFQSWSKESGFKLEDRLPSMSNPDGPVARGRIDGVKVEILTTSRNAHGNRELKGGEFYSAIRATSSKHTQLVFTIKTTSMIGSVVKKIGIDDFSTGYDQFDSQFTVETNQEDLMAKILDFHTVENLVSNAFLFDEYGLTFQQGLLRYEEHGIIETKERIENFAIIANFMAELVNKIDKLE